jgi:hypothetical protein
MNLPVHLQNRQRRDLVGAALGGINAGSPAHISIADNRFTLIDDAGNKQVVPTHHVDVCVIDANAAVSRVYFDPRVPFVPGGDNNNPPICWSDNGIGASAQAPQPQNTSCQLCPQAAWNSAVSKQTGKGVPACSSVKKIAVLVPGVNMVFAFRIPPASLKSWLKYCQTLAGHGVDLPDALTRLSFESQGVLKFEPVGYVDAPTVEMGDRALDAKATDILIGRNDRPWGGQGDQQKIAYAQTQQPTSALPSAAPVPNQALQPPPQPFGGRMPPNEQTVPFSDNSFAGAAPASPFGQPSTSSPTDVTPPKKGRGPNKPKAEPAADDGIPPFLRRSGEEAADRLAAPNPTQFGMQAAPPAPDAGVQAALDAAFRLPT